MPKSRTRESPQRTGQAVIDGNSHFYLALEENDEVYDVPVVDYPEIVTYDVGDEITLEYSEDSPANVVLGISLEGAGTACVLLPFQNPYNGLVAPVVRSFLLCPNPSANLVGDFERSLFFE